MKVNQSTPYISPTGDTLHTLYIPPVLEQSCMSHKAYRSNTPAVSSQWGIPFRGIVEAGFASPVDETLNDILHIREYVMRDVQASYMLQVEDDSLMHIGICEHDMVIFERGATVALGDLVVVRTSEGYRIVHATRILRDEIVGLVISVIRKYK